MDTKLKKSKKSLNRIILIIAICISLVPLLVRGISAYCFENSLYCSYGYKDQFTSTCFRIRFLIDYIKDSEGNINKEAIEEKVQEKKNEYIEELNYVESELISIEKQFNTDATRKEELQNKKNNLESQIKDEDKLRKRVISEVQDIVNNTEEYLKRTNINIEYYIKTDKGIISNVEGVSEEEFINEAVKGEYILFNDTCDTVETSDSLVNIAKEIKKGGWYGNIACYRIKNPLSPGDEIYDTTQKYNKLKILGDICVVVLVIDVLLLIYSIIYLIKNKELAFYESRIYKIYKKLFIEIKIILIFFSIINTLLIFNRYEAFTMYDKIQYWFLPIVAAIIVMPINYNILNSIVIYFQNGRRKLQVKNINSLVVRLYKIISAKIGRKLIIFQIIIFLIASPVVLYGVLVLFFINQWGYDRSILTTFIIYSFILLFISICFRRKIINIRDVTDNIVNGKYDNDIEIKGSKEFSEISDNLKNIQNGLNSSLQKAIKSEKMKVELITNVSHDLKTPLTSIINYVDLLDKKDVTDEEKNKYLSTLKEKSSRLKVLIEDLIEASKASSGNIELNIEEIDIVALMRQTLVEFEEKLNESGLQINKKFPKEKVIIKADGRKVFRIFQNLISNILKYSMANSRVYIKIEEEIEDVVISFRNTSKYELDFSAEDITERFKRGDKSRTTEGSGLGLSIAKSLTEIQGGSFDVVIDEDIFKIIIKFKIKK